MNCIKLILDREFYEREYETSFEMAIIGFFLSRGVRWQKVNFLKAWASAWKPSYVERFGYAVNDKLVYLDKKGNYLYFTNNSPDEDLSEDEIVTYFKIPLPQFLKLLDDWQEKVCNREPKEVIIKYENDQFIIETKD